MSAQCVYIVFIMKVQSIQKSMKGFALIATISVLLLLTLVAVAFLSLASLTVRTSRSEWAQEEARSNARLGLMIAIGELQRDLGPDQRIAVSASILDSNPDTLAIDGVTNQQWTAVMSSVYDQNQTGSPYTRDMSNGGLQDARNGTDYQARDFILNYIVSGNEGGRAKLNGQREFQDAVSQSLTEGEDAIALVSGGSAQNPADHVLVKKVVAEKEQLISDGSREFRPKGGYAFWVSSNNTKANIGRPDAHRETAIASETGIGIWRMLHPQDAEPFVIDGIDFGQQVRDNRILTPKSLTLINEANRLGVLNNYHAMTGLSSSVLCNVRDGGLKKNLSAYLHGSDGDEPDDIDSLDGSKTHYIGISAGDRLIGPPNEEYAALRDEDYAESEYHDIAPTFELLWRWAQLADEFGFGNSSSTGIRPQKLADAASGSSDSDGWDNGEDLVLRRSEQNRGLNSNVFDGEMRRPADPRNLSDVKIAPVVTEACIYYNLASYPVGTGSEQEFALRQCIYPRVGLWNPYNVEMVLDRDMVLQLFLNGKKSVSFNGGSEFTREIYYGGRVTRTVDGRLANVFDSQFGGQVHFFLPRVTIPPGETFIFSIGGSPRRLDPETFAGNRLQAEDAPSSGSYLYVDYLQDDISGDRATHAKDSDMKDSELMPEMPRTFRETPFDARLHGADNYMFMLKYLEEGATRFSVAGSRDPDPTWAREPSLVYASVSLQAGGGDEFPIAWQAGSEHPIVALNGPNDHIGDGVDPNPFTRDGFRIRWLEETASNLGSVDSPLMLQSSALGNWNLRASYICRNPFDNVSSTAPYFHGIYTRDNPSDEVSWGALSPRRQGGFQTGFPFGAANDLSVDRVIAFELPTREVGIPSLGYLRHLQLSEHVWHPSYTIGSSIADPRVKQTGTVPQEDVDMTNHGWNTDGFGINYWAGLFGNIVFELCEDNHLVFDMTYEVNHNLWSDFFLTGATQNEIANFAQNPVTSPLKNGNLRLWDTNGDATDDLNDLFRAAGRLMLNGGFDVHSTSKQAWKAFLTSTRDTQYGEADRTPFPRTLFPKGDENTESAYSSKVFTGYRSLGDKEIDSLAEAIVREVKIRAPFFGMSDFVNRRLAEDDTGRNGAIEAALERSLPNRGQNERFPITKQSLPSKTNYVAQSTLGTPTVSDSTRLDQELKPASTGYGTPGYITQGDILQVAGSGLVARSDTFTVRSYGESVDVNGNVLARAWCEAVVQRTPEPVVPDDETGMNPRDLQGNGVNFGRRFEVVSFRWLNADEV